MAKIKNDNNNLLFQKIELIKSISIDKVCMDCKKLNEINLMLEKTIEQLQEYISEKTVGLKNYVLVSEEMDQVILLLGRLTQEVEHDQTLNKQNVVLKNILHDLGLLKEKAWSLLEALDDYCKSEFHSSIW